MLRLLGLRGFRLKELFLGFEGFGLEGIGVLRLKCFRTCPSHQAELMFLFRV